MKQGKTLETLGAELQRQRAVRKDFLADTKSLVFKTEGRNSMLSVLTEKVNITVDGSIAICSPEPPTRSIQEIIICS